MADERLIVGIYLEPHIWLSNNGEKITSPKITTQECLEIVFSRTLPNGVEVCAQRQGFVIASIPHSLVADPGVELLPSNLLPSYAAPYVNDLFNAFLYMLYDQMSRSGFFFGIKPGIDNDDLWRWFDKPGIALTEVAIEQPFEFLNQHAQLRIDDAFRHSGKTIGVLTENDKIFRPNLAVSLLDAAFSAMFVDVVDYSLNWQLMALLNKAVLLTQRGEFAQAHILSWAVAEKLIDIEWKKYIECTNETFDDGAKTINSARKDILNGRDFTASVKTEVLEMAKVIPFELYKRLGPIRKARNNWIHDLKQISQEDCRECYLVARDLLSGKIGLEIQHSGGNYMFDEHIPRHLLSVT